MTVQPFQQGSSLHSMVPERYANWVLISLNSSTQNQFRYFQISVGVQDWRVDELLRLLFHRQGNSGWEVLSLPSMSIRDWRIWSRKLRLVISVALLSSLRRWPHWQWNDYMTNPQAPLRWFSPSLLPFLFTIFFSFKSESNGDFHSSHLSITHLLFSLSIWGPILLTVFLKA